jgi:UDP-N-acetylmuramyl pentapeptide phosphotransferase/UDP-N-acetylglucosamine-1-phosphate transferase
MSNLAFYIFVFILSFVLTFFVRKWAIHKAIIDHPNERSSHSIPTPRGGGIAIAVSWFVGLTYFFITNQIENKLYFALLAGIPLTITGFLDDVINLKPGIRFLIQFICAGLGLFFLSGLSSIDLGFTSFHNIWALTPIALIAIVWLINLFNFLDGIDGYISTEVIFIGACIFLFFNDTIGLLLAFSVLGFLFWNWQKAKIFMGDVSSTLLGYNVAIFAIYYQNQHKASIVIWLILTSVFWFDATITLMRRIKNKENLGQAHRKHAFQRIMQAGFSHQKTVLWAFLLNVIGFGLILLALKFPTYALFLLIIDIAILFLFLRIIDRKKPFEYNINKIN